MTQGKTFFGRKAKAAPVKPCWGEHLAKNPGLKAWAEANPELAEATRVKKSYSLCK